MTAMTGSPFMKFITRKTGNPKMVSATPVAPQGESFDDLQKDLEMQKAACKLPILDYTLFNREE